MKYGIIGENFSKLDVLENTKTGETRENDDSLFIQIQPKEPLQDDKYLGSNLLDSLNTVNSNKLVWPHAQST